MTFTRTDMLAVVERSPQATGAHDRDAWVGLFTADASIEDPVGSRPHTGLAQIGRFYDTFIGPRDIVFHRDIDITSGATVIRDLELEVTMASTLNMRIPAYLRYNLREENGELKIAALQAFWELPAMLGRFLLGGPRSVPAGAQLSRALLMNQGAGGTAGFLLGFRGVGTAAKREFTRFLHDAAAGDEVAVRRRLAKGARITSGDDSPMSAAALMTRLAGARARKVIRSGTSLVASHNGAAGREVLIAEVTPKPLVISRISCFGGPE